MYITMIKNFNCICLTGSAVKEVLRQTSEFESKASELINKDLDKIEPGYVRELEEVGSNIDCVKYI